MMKSDAKSVDEYLEGLPEDRRQVISAVRKVILKNLDKGYEEGMQYGAISYYVPHSLYPAGYHCDPSQPLPFAGLASQKNHMAVYLMCIYMEGPIREWFETAWKAAGKKLNMGKSCVRFKKLDDLAIDVLAEAIRRVPAKKYIEVCESALSARKKPTKPIKAKTSIKKPTKKAQSR